MPARLAVAFAKAGVEVSVLCPRHHPATKTRSVAQIFHFSSLNPVEAVRNAIEKSSPAVVIPCDDRSVRLLHETHGCCVSAGQEQIAALIARSLGDPASFGIVSSRYQLLNVARQEGVRVPENCLIETEGDLGRFGQQRFPWVMKIDGTSGGRGVRFVHTLGEAQRFLRDSREVYSAARVFKRLVVNRDPFLVGSWWRKSKPTVSAQAYIQGRPANCAVLCAEGRILACISVEVISADGATGPASVVRLFEHPDMTYAAERLAKRLRLSGFFGLDFVIEEGTDAAYLVEMNPRCAPPCHLQLGKGRDLIEGLVAQLSGREARDLPPVTQNSLIAYFPQAWISNSELLQSSFQDVPWGERELSEELLSPWPNRGSIYTIYQYLWTRFLEPSDTAKQG
jgi:predicted ATP-grasp superfamily ATP-dependent carboligase